MRNERCRILAVFEETTNRSALPLIIGAKPFSKAEVWRLPQGIIHLRRGAATMRIFGNAEHRIVRGMSTSRLVAVEGRFEVNGDGSWRESETLVLEYGSVSELAGRDMPDRRLSTVVQNDGSVLTSTIERVRCETNDEELLKRSTCLLHPDRSRVEEEESILRVHDRARYALRRREFDPRIRKEKALEYSYPWLPHSFYEGIWTKLIDEAVATRDWTVPPERHAA